MNFIRALFLILAVASTTQISLAHRIPIHLDSLRLHGGNESAFDAKLEMIRRAEPNSTIDLAYFIFEFDLSSSYFLRELIQIAEVKNLNIRILVDAMMADRWKPELAHLASHQRFSIRLYSPPAPEFVKYLKETLQVAEYEKLLGGISQMNARLMMEGIQSSPLLLKLFEKLKSQFAELASAPSHELSAFGILHIFLESSLPGDLAILKPLPGFLFQFSKRIHHKIALVRTAEGLRYIGGGRNWSDEYHVGTATGSGREILAKRSYPFFDADIEGLIRQEEEARALRESFEFLWLQSSNLTVEGRQSPEIAAQITRNAGAFEVYWEKDLRRQSDIGRFTINGTHEALYIENRPGAEGFQTPGASPITSFWSEKIDGAKEEIVIVSAYTFLFQDILPALRRALLRRVKISIFTNSYETTDMNMVNIAAYRQFSFWLAGLSDTERALFEWNELLAKPGEKGSLHAKWLMIDRSKLSVGSANTDPRSEDLDTNNLVATTLAPSNTTEAENFLNYFRRRLQWVQISPASAVQRIEAIRKSNPRMYFLSGCASVIAQL